MKRIPARYLFVAIAAAVFLWASAVHMYEPSPPDSDVIGWGIETPAPPMSELVATFFVAPGIVGALPIFLFAVALVGRSPILPWISFGALASGALLFWYCLGYQVDQARGLLNGGRPPRFASFYLRILAVAGFPICALGMLGVLASDGYYFAIGALGTPYWVVVADRLIVLFWASFGAFFGVRQLREHRAARALATTRLKMLIPPDETPPRR